MVESPVSHQRGPQSVLERHSLSPKTLRSEVYFRMLHEQLDRLGGNAVALDIGCGRGVARQAEPIQRIAAKCKVLWGVEPDTSIMHAPCFEKVWQTTLEDADIPDSSVDLAFSYFVIEHIVSPDAFAEKLHRILKPGGIFVAATVNAKCLFARTANVCRALHIDELVLRISHGNAKTDDYHYPTTYKMNSSSDYERLLQSGNWASIELDFLENDEWFYYFPSGFRWLGNVARAILRHPKYYSYLFVQMKK